MKYEAEAIIEMGDAVLRRALAYLCMWSVLEAAGVPAKHRRTVLDVRLVVTETESTIAIDAWAKAGSTAPIIVCGGMGLGKSYSGSRWLRACAEAGRSIAWIVADDWASMPFERDKNREQDREIRTLGDEERRALAADCVVVDDLGSGQLSPLILSRLNGMFRKRAENDRPLAIFLNEAQLAESGAVSGREWIKRNIDGRVLDRMREGGETVYLKPGKSLRSAKTRAHDDVDPKTGRGAAWKFAAGLIRRIGCTDARTGRAWSPGDQKPGEPVFGHMLRQHTHHEAWRTIADELIRAMGLNAEHVAERTAELADEADRARALVEQLDQPVELDDGRSVSSPVAFVRKLQTDTEADRARRTPGRQQHAGHVIGQAAGRPRPPPDHGPDLPDGVRAMLSTFGYKVEYSASLDVFELRFKQPARARRVEPRRRRKRDQDQPAKDRRGDYLGDFSSERAAWRHAHSLHPDIENQIRRQAEAEYTT